MGGAWFETRHSEVRYDGLSRVRVDLVAMPDGSTGEREVVVHPDAVAVVPVMDDGTVVLLRQYRHPFGDYQLEIPAGKLDVDGEGVEAAAQRELGEEAGLRAGRLERLTVLRNSAGWTDEQTHVYLGTELAAATPSDEFEAHAEEADMEVVRLPLDAAVAQVEAGALADAKTALGLLLAARRHSADGHRPGGA